MPTIAQAYKHYKDFKWEFSSKKKDEPVTVRTEPTGDEALPTKSASPNQKDYGSTQETEFTANEPRPSTSSREQ